MLGDVCVHSQQMLKYCEIGCDGHSTGDLSLGGVVNDVDDSGVRYNSVCPTSN